MRNAEKSRKQVEQVSDMVNDFTFSAEDFCEAMKSEHRTLQQSFTRLCLEWVKTCASDEYRFDGRNEASHHVCKAIVEKSSADNKDFWDCVPFI